jgi:hypothetical protein
MSVRGMSITPAVASKLLQRIKGGVQQAERNVHCDSPAAILLETAYADGNSRREDGDIVGYLKTRFSSTRQPRS